MVNMLFYTDKIVFYSTFLPPQLPENISFLQDVLKINYGKKTSNYKKLQMWGKKHFFIFKNNVH